MNEKKVSRPARGAKSPTKKKNRTDGYGQALDRLAEEFAGRGRSDGDPLAASVAIGLLQLAALWRGGSGATSVTISAEVGDAR
jgi:hypothetical protein